MQVLKRDGRLVQYDPSKVRRAIKEAFKAVDGELTEDTLKRIEKIAEYVDEFNNSQMSVEEIQDFIEQKLMSSNRKDVAKQFILYRNNRTIEREKNSTIVRKVARRLNPTKAENSNANVDERSFSGKEKEASADVFKTMAIDYEGLSRRVATAHKDMLVYQHDLEKAVVGEHNCEKWCDWITFRNRKGISKVLQFKDLDDIFPIKDDETYYLNEYAEVLGRDGWTKLEAIHRRKIKKDEPIFKIQLNYGLPLNLTGEHKIPIIRDNEEQLIKVKDLKIGDEMLTVRDLPIDINSQDDGYINMLNVAKKSDFKYMISNLKKLEGWVHYKYGKTVGQILGEDKKQITYQHQRLTLEQFEYLIQQIEIPYDILLELKIGVYGGQYHFPIIIPYTASLAKLYAYLYGDGYILLNKDNKHYQIHFANTNLNIINDFINCFEDVFKIKLKYNSPGVKDTSPCYRVTCGSRLLAQLFKDFAGGYKCLAYDISLPDFIMNGDENIKYAFLSAALDTDGSVSDNRYIYSTASDVYSDQIIKLFSTLGFNATKNLAWKKGSKTLFGNKLIERNTNGWNVEIANAADVEKLSNKLSSWKKLEPKQYGLVKKYRPIKVKNIVKEYLEGEYVYDLQTASHWYISNDTVVHNCLFLNFQEIFTNGFKTRNGDVRTPACFSTACQLVAVAFQCQSQVQFGGVASMHLDYDLAPFVKMSFTKHLKDGIEYILDEEEQKDEFLQKLLENKSINIENEYIKEKYPKLYRYAYNMLLKECKQAAEGLYHNLNTLESRQGSQVDKCAC